jgi:uncharacterized protein with ParB-like and HNH nuclease domain
MSDNKAKKVIVGELFDDFSFRIPIYQRNYAWGDKEIAQLLTDINQIGENQRYYLGTLVLYKTGDYYDVIDGQQRLTTLYLLKQILSIKKNEFLKTKNRLIFESRPKTTDFFKTLSEISSIEEIKDVCINAKDLDNFNTAIYEIDKFFEQDLKGEVTNFKNKCLLQTQIFITVLPASTNVNHHFEIMNNRGEQLEKHEILKAEFLNKLEDKYSKAKFAKIWEACSQMDNHVQYYLNKESRKTLFDQNLNSFPSDEIIEVFLENKHQKEEDSLFEDSNKDNGLCGIEIIKTYQLPSQFKQELNSDQIGKFKSIIDFENFLLQSLSLIKDYGNTNLDDKNLLKNFGYNKDSKVQFPNSVTFIKKLLQVRFLFDKYVVKQMNDDEEIDGWKWAILSLRSSNDTYNQSNTFNDLSSSDKLVMIQSMFQVSYSSNVNKTWLRDLLNHLLDYNHQTPQSIQLFLLNNMCKRYEVSGFEADQGLQTPRAVFNFLDYLLWEEYYEHVRGKEHVNDLKIDKEDKSFLIRIFHLKNKFMSFRFTQRNSIEHFFPKSHMRDLKLESGENEITKSKLIDSFGNLCLISASSNSSYNKEHPEFKKSKGRSKNESLKQQIMFEMMDGNAWGHKEIENHQKEMLGLLDSKLGVIIKTLEYAK